MGVLSLYCHTAGGNARAVAGGRLLGVAEGAGPQQALPRARGGQPVLHRAAQVPRAGAARGALPARAHLHQQAGREAVPGAPAAARAALLLSPSTHSAAPPSPRRLRGYRSL